MEEFSFPLEGVNQIGLSELVAGGDAAQQADVVFLSGEEVTDESLTNLALCEKLTMVSLCGTRVQGPGLRHLRGVSVACLAINGDGFAAGIWEELPHLSVEGLMVAGKGITAAHLSRLAGCESLRDLAVLQSPIGGEGLRVLGSLHRLTDLKLSDTGASDDDMGELSKLTKMESFSLMNDAITDAGLEHLSGLKHLRHLTVGKLPAVGESLLKFKKLRLLTLADMRLNQDVVKKLEGRRRLELRQYRCTVF